MSKNTRSDIGEAFDRGHLALALERVGRELVESPEAGMLHARAGQVNQWLNRFEAAEGNLDRALELVVEPDHRAVIFSVRGDVRSALWRLSEAEADHREAIRLNPSRLSAHQDLGRVLVRAKRKAEAEVAFVEATRDEDPEIAANALVSLARLHLSQKRYEEAMESITRAREARPLIEEEEELAHGLERVIELRPRLSESRDHQDWFEWLFSDEIRKSGPAIRAEIAEHCLRADECPFFVHTPLVMDLCKLGRHEEVLALADRTMPTGRPSGLKTFLGFAGKAADQLGKPDLAREYFERSIEVSPMVTEPYVHYGCSLLGRGRLAEAEAVLRRGMTFEEPTQDELFFNLGQSLRSQRRYPEALECYEMALELDPDYALVLTPKADVEAVLAEFGPAP